MKSKLTYAAERLAATHMISQPFGIYSQRAGRLKKAALGEVYERLRDRDEVQESSPVYAELEWKDSMVARGLRLGVEEFKKNHPECAEELERTIEHQREVRRNYVSFGFRNGSDLPDEYYADIMEEIGIPRAIVRSTLQTIRRISGNLESARGSKALLE